jgi:hypothetical protein
MAQLFEDLGHKDYEVRHAASYCIFLAGMLPSFAPQSEKAAEKIAFVIKNPKKFGKSQQNKYVTGDEIRCCHDNSVAALFSCLYGNPQLSASKGDMWQLLLKELPLQDDTEVGLIVHQKLLTSVKAKDRQDINQYLPQILSLLGQAYQSEAANDDLNKDIMALMGQYAQEISAGQGSFTENQKKKFNKIVQDFQKSQGS